MTEERRVSKEKEMTKKQTKERQEYSKIWRERKKERESSL